MESRADIPKVEERDGTVKDQPAGGLDASRKSKTTSCRYDVPVHPLYAKGFPSIGCGPCTRATFDCEDERAGRWWWEQDTEKECGIHIAPNGQVMRQVRRPHRGNPSRRERNLVTVRMRLQRVCPVTVPGRWPDRSQDFRSPRPAAVDTHASEPSGVIATANGVIPTGKLACCAARLATNSRLFSASVTYAVAPSGESATPSSKPFGRA